MSEVDLDDWKHSPLRVSVNPYEEYAGTTDTQGKKTEWATVAFRKP